MSPNYPQQRFECRECGAERDLPSTAVRVLRMCPECEDVVTFDRVGEVTSGEAA